MYTDYSVGDMRIDVVVFSFSHGDKAQDSKSAFYRTGSYGQFYAIIQFAIASNDSLLEMTCD